MVNVESLFVCKRRKGRPPDSHGSSRRTKTEPGGEGGGIFVCSDHLEHRRNTVASILVLCRSTQMFNTVECTACRYHLVITFLNSIAPLREGCKKSKWKFKMAFAIRRPTPPLMAQISRHFFTPLFFFCN